jgi:outer membrane protein assembly factor BamB
MFPDFITENLMKMIMMLRWFGLAAMIVGLVLTVNAPAWAGADGDGEGEDIIRPGDWPMYNRDPLGTRTNPDERILNPFSVSGLKVLWQIATPGIVSGTPAVVGDTVYAGDTHANVFALDAATGRTRWSTNLAGAAPGAVLTASPIVLRGRVIIGDSLLGNIFGLDQRTGKLVWQIRPNTFGEPAIWGSGTRVGGNVVIGVASVEEFLVFSGDPAAHVFSSRGSVVMLDPLNGHVLWQTFMVTPAEAKAGGSGASVWCTPTYDDESHRIFVGTGNNFSNPTTANSDALLALDADTGQIVWVNQRTPNDNWTIFFPIGTDSDFGDSPQIYRLPNGRKVVGAGQKNGFYHVLDRDTGGVVNFRQFISGGSTAGGLFADSALTNGVAFANGQDTTTNPTSCALIAIKGDASGELWRFKTNGLAVSGIAVANGVVYFKPEADPNLYALDMFTGTKLAAVPLGNSNSGPSVAHGRIFVGLGDSFVDGFQGAGGIVALGLDRLRGR